MCENENVNKVLEFLDRVQINPVSQTTPVNDENSKQKNWLRTFFKQSIYIFLCTIVVLVACNVSIYYFSKWFPHSAVPIVRAAQHANQISLSEAENYKAVVHAIARCENKHYNTIYAELRKKFDYIRYKELDRVTYENALLYLKPRLCNEPNMVD